MLGKKLGATTIESGPWYIYFLKSFEFSDKRKWAHKTEIRQERWHITKAEKL